MGAYMDSRKFTMKDESFVCEACGAKVHALGVTSRNHCPRCLYSKHVDNNPGDRMCDCHGLMQPIGLEKYRDSYKIVFKCQRCGAVKKNIVAKDDNTDKIIELSSKPV
jgi:DNA-directed RNA polymerase subunit RPC12/RpoP